MKSKGSGLLSSSLLLFTPSSIGLINDYLTSLITSPNISLNTIIYKIHIISDVIPTRLAWAIYNKRNIVFN
jgi:hypothetical protein